MPSNDALISLKPSPGVSLLAIELVDELSGFDLRRPLRIPANPPLFVRLVDDEVVGILSMEASMIWDSSATRCAIKRGKVLEIGVKGAVCRG